MAIIGKIFFGVIATILLFAIWTAGNPPAVSFFWQTEKLEIVGHETRNWYYGFGETQRTYPLAKTVGVGERNTEIRLFVEDGVNDYQHVVAKWPIGQHVKVRIHPHGKLGFPTSYLPFMSVPAFLFSFVFFMIVGHQVSGLRARLKPNIQKLSDNTHRKAPPGSGWIVTLFIALFTIAPIILFVFGLNFGDPPPKSIIWPRLEVEVVSANARIFNVGNGTKAAYVDVYIKEIPDVGKQAAMLKDITYSSISPNEARNIALNDFKPGFRLIAMRSPDDELYITRFRFSDAFALGAGVMAILCFGAVSVLVRSLI